MPQNIGRRMRRVEDPRLVTGRGRYAGDISLEGLVHVAFARSPVPRAKLGQIDIAAARALPGVLAVWTAEDLPEASQGLSDFGPTGFKGPGRPILNRDQVNHAGEAFAVVVAEGAYIAQDAALEVFADMTPLPAVGDVLSATRSGAPRLHADAPGNVAHSEVIGYGDADAAFSDDAVTASIRLVTSRVEGAAMEPRAVTAAFDHETGGLMLWSSTQNIFGVRAAVASVLGLDEKEVRVLAEDVGGGFGAKGSPFPEDVLTALVAWRLKRPARWIATRSEDSATTAHGHGSVIEMEVAADADGKLRGVRGRLLHDIGAYAGSGTGQPGIIVSHMVSAYVLPAMRIESDLVYTSTVPTGFIRGGGRPLGNYAMERVMDRLAVKLGLDPVELRRRNLIQPNQMPYSTGFPAGRGTMVYDSGDYPRLLELVRSRLADQSKWRPAPAGSLIGTGVACCVESTGFGRGEPARLHVGKDGKAHLYIGSTPQGQGHQTMAAQVAADRLGWPVDDITVTAGDTSHVPFALLTAGSRSAVMVGNAAAKAGTALRRRLLQMAGEVMEADAGDLLLEEGIISVRGAPTKRLPATEVIPQTGLEVMESFDPKLPIAYSSGCHGAAVAVDPETGHVEVLQYVIAHDTGTTINPLTLEGQMHGGYAHGLGYALHEAAIYDEDGSFRTATFLDYSIVSANEVTLAPELEHIETRTTANPENFKGAGESGTIPVPAAISNAVEDAIRKRRPSAVVNRLPITPESVLDLLHS